MFRYPMNVCFVLAFLLTAALAHADTKPVTTTPITVTAPDGVALQATYFSPGRPGPGILLLHQCNRDRASWAPFATEAAARGYHVLTLDYRGYGESGGDRFEDYQRQQPIMQEKWPGDIDAAFSWLLAQNGVDRDRIGAAGASCGVNQSILLARRHPEVKTLVLLSGGSTPEGREYLRHTPGLSLFAAASHDDGDVVGRMKWLLGWSQNEQNRFEVFKAAGHGTEMFAVEAGLPPAILEWFDARLRTAPAVLAKAGSAAPATPVQEFWLTLTQPGGIDRARRIFEDARRRDPDAELFPEGEANAHGYSLLQAGNAKDAIAVFELTVAAFPGSANAHDSLSDAHLAAGNSEQALRHAEKALGLLDADPRATGEFRETIRKSAETKISQLRKK
jgi:dienelactone hydrolase